MAIFVQILSAKLGVFTYLTIVVNFFPDLLTGVYGQ